jgi:hypothetical protein
MGTHEPCADRTTGIALPQCDGCRFLYRRTLRPRECGDPTIDAAIRRIGTAWIRGGLDPEALVDTWSGPLVDRIFAEDPTLLDAIDDIIRTVHRVQFSRPRGGVAAKRPVHRPGSMG